VNLPRSVQEKLSQPALAGERHHQMTHLVKALLGAGWTSEEVFRQFRSMYDADITDQEIWGIIKWGLARNPTPPRSKGGSSFNSMTSFTYTAPPPQTPAEIANSTSVAQAIRNALDYLDGFEIEEVDLWEASIVRPGDDWRTDSLLVLETLYSADELACINTDFRLDKAADGELRPTIIGPGVTHQVERWKEIIRATGSPSGNAGAWVRLNPVTMAGSGKAGAHTDDDVIAYRFILVEFDKIPLGIQLSLLASLYWPVAMICSSGGRSYHGWVLSECEDRDSYDHRAEEIYRGLAKFKVDTGNGNPSRYGRLPGVQRKLGATPPGEQRIVYLNPSPKLHHPIL
jgi:hypothetical protein